MKKLILSLHSKIVGNNKPPADSFKQCPKCRGSGFARWAMVLGEINKCKRCDGSGQVKTK